MGEANRIDEHPAEPQSPPADASRLSAWRLRVAVLRHQGIVYRVAYSLLRDKHEAEDAAQETFVRYWSQGGGVRAEREWLLKVTRNICLDRLRRHRRTRADGAAGAAAEEQPDERDPPWHLQQDELAARLRAHIDELPEPQRSLVVLFDMHGLDGAACARILDLNVNQVKVYLHRARRRLRRALEESS